MLNRQTTAEGVVLVIGIYLSAAALLIACVALGVLAVVSLGFAVKSGTSA